MMARGDTTRRRGGFRRFLAGLLLLPYAVLTVAIPLAHAAEAGSRSAAAHVEPFGEGACPPLHDHVHCQACSLVRLVGPAPTAAPVPEPVALVAFHGEARSTAWLQSTTRLPLGSRAPPLA